MSDINLQSITKQAEKIALSVDESVREAAYNRAFDFLIQQQSGGFSEKASGKQNIASERNNLSETLKDEITILMQIDRTKYPEVLDSSSVLDRSLYLLRIANNECQIDGLKASQIAKVLTDKFKVRTPRKSVASALDRAGNKVDSIPDKNGTVYRIMASGESYLDSGGEKNSEQDKSVLSGNGKSVQARKVQERESVKTLETSSKKRSGRPGPKAIITQLIADGFFKTSKVVNDIQTHIESNQGYKFKTTELTPALVRLLREKVIVREKNSDGQYEYKGR